MGKPRKTTCTNLGHPRAGQGPVIRETEHALFIDLVCSVCGLSQGIQRKVVS